MSRREPPHSGESRNPGAGSAGWIPAFAGMTEKDQASRNVLGPLIRGGVLILVLAAVLFCAAPSRAAHAPGSLAEKRILLLYAYGYGGRGVELFSDGFFRALTDARFPVTNVHAEYLDLQRNRDVPGYREELRDLLTRKYAHTPIDLVVTLQQPALGFLLDEGRDIAPQAPVVTAQHRPLLESEKAGRRVVGEVNQFDIKGTLESALVLFPRTQRVVFVSGSSEADRAVAHQAQRVAESWRGKLELEFTTDRTLGEILERVGDLPPHSVIIFTQYNRDTEGHVALAYEVENMVVQRANAPVFGFYDFNLRNGGIGGSVIPVEASGMRMAELALEILRGKSAEQSGVLKTKENVLMFDWRQIQRWKGDPSGLPAHAVFVNRPPSAWQQYGTEIVVAVLVLVAQGGLIVALVGSIRLRRRAEKVRDESEQRFRATFEQAAVGIAMVTLDGHWLRVNDRLCQIVGYRREELMGGTFEQITHPEDLESDLANARRVLAGEIDSYTMEKRYLRKDGAIVWINLTVSLLRRANGEPDYFISVVEDIQARKDAELALARSQAVALEGREQARLAALNQMEDAIAARISAERAQGEISSLNADLERRVAERTAELTAANRELDSFAYAVSHDLRAPLRAMNGFAQALNEEYGERLEGEGKAYLEQIDIACRKMSELIEGILSLSRSTRGELRRDAVDVSALARTILAELQRDEPERRVEAFVAPGLCADGDARMVESVLRNLLGNAWKYTGKTPAPVIRVHSGVVEGAPAICVADNGDGFDMSHVDQLFKPFRRLHRQDEFPGIGIGLATVQRIVHRHGGKIVVSAAPGRGATFCFSLADDGGAE